MSDTPTIAKVFDLPQLQFSPGLRPDGWRRSTGRIRCRKFANRHDWEDVTVPVWEPEDVPGLMYNRMTAVPPTMRAYSVTHAASGLRCGPPALSHAEARAILAELGAGLDWTQSRSSIKANPDYHARYGQVALLYCDSLPPWMTEDMISDVD